MKISLENLKSDLKRVRNISGILPTIKYYRQHGEYGVNTIKRSWGSWNKALVDVWNETNKIRHDLQEIICPACLNKFKQKFFNQKYCSQKCSALINNKIKPKRKKAMKKCNSCENMVPKRDMYCEDCKNIGKNLRGGMLLKEKTIQEIMDKGSNRYNVIRGHARKLMKNKLQVCENCGYKKHVETCHKKEISKYPKTTKIREINVPENLLILCRNCHWELDHGILNQ